MQVRVENSRIFLTFSVFISRYSREIRAISCSLMRTRQIYAAIASEFSDLREFLPAGPLKSYPVGMGLNP